MNPALEPTTEFAPHERPLFAGSPFSPSHTTATRVIYALTALVTGAGASFGNALTNVNVSAISGSFGLYVVEASVLPAIFVAMNATANLTLVKARAQFGIPEVTAAMLAAYALAALAQLLAPSYPLAMLVRATSGLSAAALTTLTIYYLVQIFPPKAKPLGLVIGIGLTQLATPLARLVPVELLAADAWHGLRCMEVALGAGLLALVLAVRLPPSEKSPAFEPLDALTIALVVPALLALCEVLSLGRLYWWTDSPKLGMALVLAIPVLALAMFIESSRQRPLVQVHWLGTAGMLRFVGVALLVRLALAEQTFGAVGLLTSGGLNNDQLRTLFLVVVGAMVLGIVCAALTLSEERLPWQVMTAALVIAVGAWLDGASSNLTRPTQLMWSQALLGFGTTLFVGPALVYGFLQMLQRGGGKFLVTFVVAFSSTQNVGGLMGSAWLGSWQIRAAREAAQELYQDLAIGSPNVVARLQVGERALAPTLTDPALRSAEGGALLVQSVQRESGVIAYNTVFQGVAIAASLIALFIATQLVRRAGRRAKEHHA